MIDWYFAFVHSLWLVGAAFVLAAFSYLDWYAQETEIPRRELFRRPMWRVPASGGLLLVCLCLGLRRDLPIWEQAAWAALGAVFAWGFVKAAIDRRRESPCGNRAPGRSGGAGGGGRRHRVSVVPVGQHPPVAEPQQGRGVAEAGDDGAAVSVHGLRMAGMAGAAKGAL